MSKHEAKEFFAAARTDPVVLKALKDAIADTRGDFESLVGRILDIAADAGYTITAADVQDAYADALETFPDSNTLTEMQLDAIAGGSTSSTAFSADLTKYLNTGGPNKAY